MQQLTRKLEEWSVYMAKKLILTMLCRRIWGSICNATWLQLEESFGVARSTVKTGIPIYRLTHWGQDKMAATFQTKFSNPFSWMKIFELRFRFSLKFVPEGSINNISALVQIMAWRRPGDKLLSEPVMDSLLTHIWVNEHTIFCSQTRPIFY